MNSEEAADYLRISMKTLSRITKLGRNQQGPKDKDRNPLARELPVARIGRSLVYRKTDLDRYRDLKILAA